MDDGFSNFNDKVDFKYVLGEKDDAMFILFYGKMGAKGATILETCQVELLSKDKKHKVLILNFRDVTGFMPAAHSAFAKFQKAFRDKGAMVAICGMKPDIKSALLLAGIVREN